MANKPLTKDKIVIQRCMREEDVFYESDVRSAVQLLKEKAIEANCYYCDLENQIDVCFPIFKEENEFGD